MPKELIHIIFESILGGSLIVTLCTLGATIRKANADARKSRASAVGVEVEGAKSLLDAYGQYVVAPITLEIEKLRNEINIQNNAISRTSSCVHVGSCPVVAELQNNAKYISDGTPIANDK